MRGLTRWTTTGLILLSLTVAISGFRCAEVVPGWGDNDGEDHGDGGKKPDGDADTAWHCYTGTPQTEEQLFNKCTEAEKVDRATTVPPALWDPQTPLPP